MAPLEPPLPLLDPLEETDMSEDDLDDLLVVLEDDLVLEELEDDLLEVSVSSSYSVSRRPALEEMIGVHKM